MEENSIFTYGYKKKLEVDEMKEMIRKQIMEIPSGLVFDTHAVVANLVQNDTNKYLSNFKGETAERYHGIIGKVIAEFELGDDKLVERMGRSWSKNIRDNFTDCACWKKN